MAKANSSAAFGRLRVETSFGYARSPEKVSAAFGRLRVETLSAESRRPLCDSAAFGRLRVETRDKYRDYSNAHLSRLRAAAC